MRAFHGRLLASVYDREVVAKRVFCRKMIGQDHEFAYEIMARGVVLDELCRDYVLLDMYLQFRAVQRDCAAVVPYCVPQPCEPLERSQ